MGAPSDDEDIQQSGDYGQPGAEHEDAHDHDGPYRHGGPVAEGDEHGTAVTPARRAVRP